jgi:hypothetical protein
MTINRGQVWERSDGMIVIALDELDHHARLKRFLTFHSLVVACPPNHFPEGFVLMLSFPLSELWRRVA